MLVCPGHEDGKLVPGVVGWEFLRTLSTECTKARIRLETVSWHQDKESIVFMDSRGNKYQALPEFDSVHGYIHLLLGRNDFRNDIVKMLAQKKQPVVTFDQLGDKTAISKEATKRTMLILSSMVTESPGRAMARYLLSLGHRRIAFISPFPAYPWSQKRLAGMKQEYEKAGRPDGIMLFAPSDITSPFNNIPETLKESGIQPALRSFNKWLTHTDKAFAFEYRKRVPDAVQHVLTDGELRRRLEPVFKKILADRSITAWAAANDTVAFYALDFLHEQGVEVPREVSIVGFDDLADSLQYNLTTYNFNTPAIVTQCLAHIFRLPHATLARSKSGKIEIAGMVVERGTAGRAQ
jgi:DNA-binding LacI/PurR family transcriptional regulator